MEITFKRYLVYFIVFIEANMSIRKIASKVTMTKHVVDEEIQKYRPNMKEIIEIKYRFKTKILRMRFLFLIKIHKNVLKK